MSRETVAKVIKEFCYDKDYTFSKDYSGRGMFGRQCVSITCASPLVTLMELCDYLHDEGFDNAQGCLGTPKMDNMGYDMVLYFPSVTMED